MENHIDPTEGEALRELKALNEQTRLATLAKLSAIRILKNSTYGAPGKETIPNQVCLEQANKIEQECIKKLKELSRL